MNSLRTDVPDIRNSSEEERRKYIKDRYDPYDER